MLVDPASVSLAQDLVFGAVFLSDIGSDTSPEWEADPRTSETPWSSGTPASMLIVGVPAESVSIDTPGIVELTRVGGNEHLTIATAVLGTEARRGAWATIGSSGETILRLGGRLNLDRNSVAGEYRGLLVMTAQYN